jgi:O-antigen ligase
MAIGIIVLLARRKKTKAYLVLMIPIIVYFLYCLISVSWSAIPFPALKRWTKDLGDVVMVLIVATDPQPIAALRRLYTRVGFILLPFSVALIRYTTMGRYWDNDGKLAVIGVTGNKNVLGLIVFVISLGALWNLRWLLASKGEPNRRRRLLAQGVLLLFGLALLTMAHSSTSLACFLLGSGILLATHLRAIRRRPSRMHWLCLAVIVAGGLALLFGGEGEVAGVLGRQADLSGRTAIWAALFPAVSNPILGAGFDSFWSSPNALIFQHNLRLLHWYHPENLNEAHNGYIEVYLNLGWIGVCLIALILTTGYWRASKALRRDPEVGSLFLAIIMSGVVYSITEAGFRTMSPMWFFLLLAIVGAAGVSAKLFVPDASKIRVSHKSWVSGTSKNKDLESQAVYTINEPDSSFPRWSKQGAPQQKPWTIR